jgi:hypothetical protein
MPPTRRQPAAAAADEGAAPPPIQRALDFRSPPPKAGADGAIQFNEKDMERTWKGSLIQVKPSGEFLQCAGIEFKTASPLGSLVLFRSGASGASKARFPLQDKQPVASLSERSCSPGSVEQLLSFSEAAERLLSHGIGRFLTNRLSLTYGHECDT